MTATRIVRGATIAVGAAVWLLLAFLLSRTTVPANLHVPHLDERQVFGSGLVKSAVRFERFLDWNWVLATVAALVANIVMVRRGRTLVGSFGLGPVNAGIVVGVVTLTLVWAATLPFALADAWWERRHGISREGYVTTLTDAWLALLGRTIVAVVALAIVPALARRRARAGWLAAAPAIAGILLVLQFFSPYLATLGTHPVRSPRLRAEIRTLEHREHAGRPPVRVDDVSGQTRVANAFSIGIRPTHRSLLPNTLLARRFTP